MSAIAPLEGVTQVVAERGDLAHLVLFLWATSASGLLVWALKELVACNRRFEAFVEEIARISRLFDDRA